MNHSSLIAATLVLCSVSAAPSCAATKIDRSDPMKFLYSLYGCDENKCYDEKRSELPDTSLSAATGALFKKLSHVDFPCVDYNPLTDAQEGGPTKIVIHRRQDRESANVKFVRVELFGDLYSGDAKDNYSRNKIFLLVKEHGLWAVDDIMSHRSSDDGPSSLRDDVIACLAGLQ